MRSHKSPCAKLLARFYPGFSVDLVIFLGLAVCIVEKDMLGSIL